MIRLHGCANRSQNLSFLHGEEFTNEAVLFGFGICLFVVGEWVKQYRLVLGVTFQILGLVIDGVIKFIVYREIEKIRAEIGQISNRTSTAQRKADHARNNAQAIEEQLCEEMENKIDEEEMVWNLKNRGIF